MLDIICIILYPFFLCIICTTPWDFTLLVFQHLIELHVTDHTIFSIVIFTFTLSHTYLPSILFIMICTIGIKVNRSTVGVSTMFDQLYICKDRLNVKLIE